MKHHKARNIASVLLLSLADFAAAQDAITTKCNMMRDADSLSMQRMEYLWAGEKGKKQIWDFSSLEALRGDYPVKICVDSTGTIGRYDSNSIRQYRLKSQALHMTHYEDRLELVRYDKAKLAMRYPFQYGDSIAEPFSGEGIYCGDHKVKVEGQVILQADGAGTLILSERDTLHKALRVCTITTTSMAMDVDSAYIDPDNLKQEVEERYDWYVPGYRYPLYTTIQRTSYANLTPVASRSWAYRLLPDELSHLDDAVNDSIRKNASSTEAGNTARLSDSQQDESAHPDDILHYNVNLDGRQMTLTYTLDADGTVNILIADVMGLVYRRYSRTTKAGETATASFDCSGLRSGKYILYINVNGIIHSEKVTLR